MRCHEGHGVAERSRYSGLKNALIFAPLDLPLPALHEFGINFNHVVTLTLGPHIPAALSGARKMVGDLSTAGGN